MSKRKKRPVLVGKILSWIAFRIYMFLFFIVERLSVKHADQFGRFLGGLLFNFSSHRRKIVEENVRTLKAWAKKRNLKNPLLDEDNRTISKRIYQSSAGNFFYSFALMNKSEATIEKNIRIRDLELLKRVYEKNKGMIMLFAHAGPFELTVMLPKLMPSIFNESNIAVMYRPFNNRYINQWYLRKRSRFDAQLFSREDGFFKIIRYIKNGGFMNIAFDIRMHQGEKIELFDRLASTSKIPYALYKATQAPVFVMRFVRVDDVSWEIQFKEILSSRDGFCSEIEFLNAANEHLEKIIFESPYDYFFFQNRYK